MADEPGPDRALAFGALLALLTAVLLPYWVVTLTQQESTRTLFYMFRNGDPVVNGALPIVTGVVVAFCVLVLFLRLAARSWFHEPIAWMRALIQTAAGSSAALVMIVFWPATLPSAWGQRTLRDDSGAVIATETTNPGLGWFLILVASGLLWAAWWITRKRELESKEPDTSDK